MTLCYIQDYLLVINCIYFTHEYYKIHSKGQKFGMFYFHTSISFVAKCHVW